jgi:hypothetical protein
MFVVAEYWFLLIGSLKFCHWFVNTISSNTISKKIASEAHAAESFSRRCYQIKKIPHLLWKLQLHYHIYNGLP